MKNIFTVLSLMIISVFAVVTPASARGTLGNNYTMEIVNNSSYVIYEVRASNLDDPYWGENLLRRNLYPGRSVVLDVDDYSGYCIYDLYAEGENGVEWKRFRINVCEEYYWNLYD